MRAKLCRSGQGGQSRNGGEFPLAPVEDVIGKDGAEEVILEVRVDVGRERVHGTGNGAPHQFGLRFRTDLVQIGALGQRCESSRPTVSFRPAAFRSFRSFT